jgi:hypothetical protein
VSAPAMGDKQKRRRGEACGGHLSSAMKRALAAEARGKLGVAVEEVAWLKDPKEVRVKLAATVEELGLGRIRYPTAMDLHRR